MKELDYILEKGKEYIEYFNNNDLLIQALNKIPTEELQNIFKEYGNAISNYFSPIKTIRGKIAYDLIKGKTITKKHIEEIKEKIRSKDLSFFDNENITDDFRKDFLEYNMNKTYDIFVAWKNLWRILYPFFYYGETKLVANKYLKYISEKIMKDLSLVDYDFHIVDFDGENNFGSYYCQIAIFPEIKKDHKNAYQFYIQISDMLKGGIIAGSYLKDKESNNIIEVNNYEALIENLERFKDEIISKNKNKRNYFKIAPGKNAVDWEDFRNNNYISINYDNLIKESLNNFSTKEEFNIACGLESNSPSNQTQSMWQFKNANIGDVVFASRGMNTCLGIGIITGEYFFEKKNDISLHKRKVEWITDKIYEYKKYSYKKQKTLFRMDSFVTTYTCDFIINEYIQLYPELKNVFEKNNLLVSKNESSDHMPKSDEGFFKIKSIKLLNEINKNPQYDFYKENESDIKNYIENPIKEIMNEIKDTFPEMILKRMETEKNIFSRFRKNDFGRGGLWDFFWGAFYPVDYSRVKGSQLFVLMNKDVFRYGFSIAYKGSENSITFIKNMKKYGKETLKEIKERFGIDNLYFGDRLEIDNTLDFEKWFGNIDNEDLTVCQIIKTSELLSFSKEEIKMKIKNIFEALFPLVLMSLEEEPIDFINNYLNGTYEEKNPGYTLEECSSETGIEVERLEIWKKALKRKKQVVFYGPPGTGKTFIAKKISKHLLSENNGKCEIIQFHPSYSYEDFIEGIRPKTDSNGVLTYPVKSGRFVEFCKEAEVSKDPYVMIIDEINRANLSRVFGELMFLLEYRDEKIKLAVSGKDFKIPDNVYLIGTMNTADRSIALVDHALRRRFAFLKLFPEMEVIKNFHFNNLDSDKLINLLKKMNSNIEDNYQVGISFFLRENLHLEIEDIWKLEIEPYLEEYFFDDKDNLEKFKWDKIKDELFD